ncbi:MAG: ATP-binding protein [Methanomassiliicoccales archaeon]|nr:MAG: ATP-binding protein [Methanomassiliicoccales archaeon]
MEVKSKKKSGKEARSETKTSENLRNVKHKILVLSGKGGVGKSTVAANLALSFSMNGSEVGLLDVDIHGPDIPKMLGIEDERLTGGGNGIIPVPYPPHLKVMSMAFLLSDKDSPVIWRGPLKMKAIQQFIEEVDWGKLDYLIMDLPPGTGDEPLSVAHLIPDASGAVIVTTSQDVALLDSRKAVNFVRALNLPIIGIIENMSGFNCPHCGERIDLFKAGGGEKAAKELGVPFLGRVPLDPKIAETGDSGEPFVLSYPRSESAETFKIIVKRIEKFVRKRE